jgi:hypothetical protein
MAGTSFTALQPPDKETLPDDIKGLVDDQAASVSLAGFRHEMAGVCSGPVNQKS